MSMHLLIIVLKHMDAIEKSELRKHNCYSYRTQNNNEIITQTARTYCVNCNAETKHAIPNYELKYQGE